MAPISRAEVIVIGAGMSGLTAASALNRQGVDVIVLEASSRVGGRVNPEVTKAGSHIDLGGQWIGHGHHRLEDLIKKAGGTPYKTYTRGLPVIVRSYRTISLLSPSVIVAILYLLLLELVSRIYVPRSWITVTVDRAIAKAVPLEGARQILRLICDISSTTEISMYSMYSLAKTIPLSGGLMTMLGTEGGAQDALVVESMGIATSMLSRQLSERILTDMPVTQVFQNGTGEVTVHTRSGWQFQAKKVIITVPPPMQRNIAFNPPLPAERQALQINTRMGVVYKAIAVFEKPFWRDGLGGEFLVLDRPAFGVFDSSSPGGPGHLCFLVAGTHARDLDILGSVPRRELLLSRLVPHLGRRVLEPLEWHEKLWHVDEYCGGGYLAFPVAGTTEGTLPMPHTAIGNLHWAGTETAQEHPGYIEGAIQSGERVADEVVCALRNAGASGQR
ncbi:hypothetical protein K4F52_009844 [Lecanicillium sp. MT-2017a]|nr:hypothetical protein K4F52_009844 [Lecanicillium sp. MT-2017a]